MTQVYSMRGSRLLALGLLAAGFVWSAGLGAQSPAPGPDARGTDLVRAAEAGRADLVRAALAAGADANALAPDGSTAILWAAYTGDVESVRALIAAKADVGRANRYGMTPLIQASRLGSLPVVRLLLEAGADATVALPEGETPLMAAAGAGNTEIVRLLLAAGANVNARETAEDQTALMWAADEGHLEVVRLLLSAGADPNTVAKPTAIEHAGGEGGRMYVNHSSRGLTPLMFAARRGQADIAQALVEAGATLDTRNPDGLTAMMIAVLNDHLDAAGRLADLGADVNDGTLYEVVQTANLRTNSTTGEATRPRPMHQNTLTPVTLAVRLLEKGADPMRVATHTLNFNGSGVAQPVNESAFGRALGSQDVALVRAMMEHGVQANAPLPTGDTPLMALVGAGPGRGGFGFGATPAAFRFPGERGVVATAQVLLDAGADVNAVNPDGDTALHKAAQGGNVELIRLLATRGAVLDVKNGAGLTPLDLASGRRGPGQAPARGRGGPPGRGGGGPQPAAMALLRELMGLPAEAAAASEVRVP